MFVLHELFHKVIETGISHTDMLITAAVVYEEGITFHNRAGSVDDAGFPVILIPFIGFKYWMIRAKKNLGGVIEIKQHCAEFVAIGVLRVHRVVEKEPTVLSLDRWRANTPSTIVPRHCSVRQKMRVRTIESRNRFIKTVEIFDTYPRNIIIMEIMKKRVFTSYLFWKKYPILVPLIGRRKESHGLPTPDTLFEVIFINRGQTHSDR